MTNRTQQSSRKAPSGKSRKSSSGKSPSSKTSTPAKATTPPKGQPTRSRHDVEQSRGVLGANWQWLLLSLIGLALLIFVLSTVR